MHLTTFTHWQTFNDYLLSSGETIDQERTTVLRVERNSRDMSWQDDLNDPGQNVNAMANAIAIAIQQASSSSVSVTCNASNISQPSSAVYSTSVTTRLSTTSRNNM